MRTASLPLALLASVLVATASARVAQQRPLLLGSREATAAAVRTVLRPVRRTRRGLPSGRYLLEYADVRPYDERSAECQLFLATNVAFFAVGGCVAGGEPLLALQLELAGVCSVWYHLNQCSYGGTRHPLVQLAMLVDYAFAVPAALRALVLAAELGDAVPDSALALAVAAVAALVAGWVWDGPRSYMVVHGMWHVFGAIAAYQIAMVHAAVALG